MSTFKRLLNDAEAEVRFKRLDFHFKSELESLKKRSPLSVNPLDAYSASNIRSFYQKFGFRNIDIRWHEYLYTVTGNLYKEYIPENFYHCVIEPLYTQGSADVEDKAYMARMLPGINMVSCIIKNVNGIILDDSDNILSEESAKHILQESNCDLIIKPSRGTGGGKGVKLIHSDDFNSKVFVEYGKDFVVQKCIKQSLQYKAFNPSSVNTEKIISFLFNGKVHILTSILRVGAPGEHTDTASTGRGYTVGINADGQLNSKGYNVFGESREMDASGRKFSEIRLTAHSKICDEIIKAHRMLPRYGIISWDFAVDDNNVPILIEYNLNYPDVLIYQMNNGPLFGNLTEAVLMDVSKKIRRKNKNEVI